MGWVRSLLPNGIKMNVGAVGLNTSLNSVIGLEIISES